MAQNSRGSKTSAAANRTIAAFQFHTERVKQKNTDIMATSDHNAILGTLVDLHHRNMSLVRASMLKFEPLEGRSSGTLCEEVDEFADDSASEEGETESAGATDSGITIMRGHNALSPSPLDRGAEDAVATARTHVASGPSATARKVPQELDPVALFRQMRAGAVSRSSQHRPSSLKGAYAFLPRPVETEPAEEDEGTKVDVSTLRGRSFLCAEEQGATYDMLAQIRGAKWTSDSSSAKAGDASTSKSPLGRANDTLGGSRYRSDLRGAGAGLGDEASALSSSLGASTASGFPPLGSNRSSLSGMVRGSGALPGVSVDSSPLMRSSVDVHRPPGCQSGTGSSSGGLLSKLKNMMKN